MSNVRKAMKLADPEALSPYMDRERRREQRRFERMMLAAALVTAIVAAALGWYLYIAGHGCGVAQ